MNRVLDPVLHPWMDAPPTRAVMDALTDAGGAARFVGGVVRDALLGRPVGDIDIATPLVPQEVMRRLEAHGLKAIPTGIAYGTVTALAQGRPFEVTTLRRDVATDGRRAVVAFATDWAEDAARRDFTMNALYAECDGTLFDPCGGVADLVEGQVRFVGNALARVKEDYLRILRLFRFHAWYGKAPLGEDALSAAQTGRAGLATLSGERVQKEILKLLQADDPRGALRAMQARGILSEIFPAPLDVARLERLVTIEAAIGLPPDAVLRLAALLGSDKDAAQAAKRMRLSNVDRERVLDATLPDAILKTAPSVLQARQGLYHVGNARFQDRILLSWAAMESGGEGFRQTLENVKHWTGSEFPLSGADALAAGVPQGPEIGRILSRIEEEWIAKDFALGRDQLLARLKILAAR